MKVLVILFRTSLGRFSVLSVHQNLYPTFIFVYGLKKYIRPKIKKKSKRVKGQISKTSQYVKRCWKRKVKIHEKKFINQIFY